MRPWLVYILKCADHSYYTGVTNDLPARLAKHEAGLGAKYMRGRAPFCVVYSEELPSKSLALRREIEIKALSRSQKQALIRGKSFP